MDKLLLNALNKTSDAIQALADALESNQKATSASANALKSGNFGTQLKDINVSLQAIRKDTQEIIKQNKTILAMSKKKDKVKDSPEDKMPDDKKSGDIKKGVGTILLIAGAVLAIGLALKIVGKVDFISVIGLGLAITLIATAFAKVASLKLTMKEAMVASGAMIAMSLGITVSSWILTKIQPIGFTQVLTGILISGMFAVAGKGIGKLINVLSEMGIGKIVKSLIFLPLIMPAIALGITLSSWVLKLITPIGFTQALTAILISVMFSVVASGMKKMILAFDKIGMASLSTKIKFLPLVMVGIAAGITFSSWILKMITPISFGQALTGILISAMFVVVAINLPKLVKSVKNMKPTDAAKLVLLLPAISTGITLSSWILKMITPIGFTQALTGILISAMFAVVAINLPRLVSAVRKMEEPDAVKLGLLLPAMSAAITASSWILSMVKPITFAQFATALAISIIFIPVAFAVSLIVKKTSKMKWADVAKIPTLFVLLSTAITLSSHIFSMMKPIPYGEMFKILVFSVVLTIALVAIGFAGWLLTKMFSDTKKVKEASKSIVILASAIAAASLIISIGKYDVYPGWKWSLFTGLAIIIYGGVGWVLNFLLKNTTKAKDAAKMILILSATLAAASHIIATGNYTKYPNWKWALSTGLAIVAFGIVGVVLNKIGGIKDYVVGSLIILLLSVTIIATSHIIAAGNYNKYPPLKWILGTAAAIGAFGLLSVAMGLVAMSGIGLVAMLAGAGVILALSATIVGTSQILSKGKYDIPGFVGWSIATVLLFSTFAPLILILGAVAAASALVGFFTGVNPFEEGKKAFISIAETIVEISYVLKKGAYSGGPSVEWARGVAISLGAFMPIYNMLLANSIMKMLGGGGAGPEDFKSAIIMVSEGIVAAADFFSKNKASFENPPPVEWAKGVGRAIGAFAPVFAVLQEGKSWFGDTGMQDVENMKTAIMVICRGIVEAAEFFSQNKAPFNEGNYPSKKWGKGVGAAIGAFTPVFETLSKTPWYKNPGETIQAMSSGIKTVSQAIIDAGIIFFEGTAGNSEIWNAANVPNKKWGEGVSGAISAFSQVFELMAAGSGLFTSQGEVAEDLGKGITIIAKAIAGAGNVLSGAKPKAFESFPSPLWGIGLKQGIDSFLKIFDTLEARKMDAAGFSKMAKMLEGGVSSMAAVARILHQNSKFFTIKLDPSFVKNISKNIIEFTKLGIELDKMLVTTVTKTTKSGGFFGIGGSTKTEQVRVEKDMGIIDRVAQAMSNTAFIIWKNSKYFSTKIDPTFVRKLGSNVHDYVGLAVHLMKNQAALDSMGGKEGNPIDKVAKGMVTLASAYDKLARALERYAKATAMVTAVAAAQKAVKDKKGELSGVKSAPSEKSGGPQGAQKYGESQGAAVSSKINKRRFKEKWEIDIEAILKNLKVLTSEEPNKPGLIRVLIDKQTEANTTLITLVDELEEANRREKKRDKKSGEEPAS